MRLLPQPPGAARVLRVSLIPVSVAGSKPRAHDVQPLRFEIGGGCDRQQRPGGWKAGAVRGASNRFPFETETFDAVLLLDVLEYVVDEEALLAEAVRVLRPGGTLVLRVPRDGPAAWLDSMNLYRYFADATHRARTLPETYAIGWRRHYSRREIDGLLKERGLCRLAMTATGLGLAEPINLVLMLLFRWLLRREHLYQRTRPLRRRLTCLDQRLSLGSFGFHLTAVAQRMDQPSPGEALTAPRPPATPPAPASRPSLA